MVSFDKEITLVMLLAWHQWGDKPLSEPKMIKLSNAIKRHQALSNTMTFWKPLFIPWCNTHVTLCLRYPKTQRCEISLIMFLLTFYIKEVVSNENVRWLDVSLGFLLFTAAPRKAKFLPATVVITLWRQGCPVKVFNTLHLLGLSQCLTVAQGYVDNIRHEHNKLIQVWKHNMWYILKYHDDSVYKKYMNALFRIIRCLREAYMKHTMFARFTSR